MAKRDEMAPSGVRSFWWWVRRCLAMEPAVTR